MKAMKLTFSILALVFFCGQLFAQTPKDDNDAKKDRRIIIIKKTVDDEGNETIEKIVKEGDEAENFIWHDADGNDFKFEHLNDFDFKVLDENGELLEGLNDKLENIEIEMHAINNANLIKIKYLSDDGEDLNIEWEGIGDIPDDVKKKLEEKGIHLEQLHGIGADAPHFQFKADGDNAFLGVVLGKKVTVENSNGVETENIEGESELGVVVGKVVEGSAAEAAGLQAKDIITALDGTPMKTVNQLTEAIGEKNPGDKVTIAYLRDGETAQTEATLTEHIGGHNAIFYEWDDDGENSFEIDGDGDHNVFFFQNEEDDDDGVVKKRKIIIIKKGERKENAVEIETEIAVRESSVKEGSLALQLKSFSAFPNPTDGVLRVQFDAEAVPTEIKIMDISGKVFYKEFLNGFDGQYDKQISLKDAPKGTLLLSIRQGKKTHTQKIVYE